MEGVRQHPRQNQRSTVKNDIKMNLKHKLKKFTERASVLYTDSDKYYNLAREKQYQSSQNTVARANEQKDNSRNASKSSNGRPSVHNSVEKSKSYRSKSKSIRDISDQSQDEESSSDEEDLSRVYRIVNKN